MGLSRSGRCGEEKILGPIRTRIPTPRPSSPSPVAKPTASFGLSNSCKADESITFFNI
jgi:hypothetical protein